jgi:magnesium transporter
MPGADREADGAHRTVATRPDGPLAFGSVSETPDGPPPAPNGASRGAPGTHALCLQNPPVESIAEHVARNRFFWVDLESPDDQYLRELGALLHLHPLTIDDAQTFRERPKFEEYPTYVYMVVYGVDPGATSGSPLLREVHLIVSGDCVVTIHHRPIDALETLHNRYNDQPIRSEQMLIYRILDAIISTFFPVLGRIDDDIDEIEDQVIDDPTEANLRRIYSLKRDLVAMRRVVTPLRDVFARNAEHITDLPGMQPDDRPYFRDLYDSLIRVADLVDSYRDLLSGATDLYLSTVANRQGEVNKQLTIIATIFLPLTFLTGFFGQNFAFLTGHVTDTTWSFLVFGLGFLALSAIGFVVYFKSRSWI